MAVRVTLTFLLGMLAAASIIGFLLRLALPFDQSLTTLLPRGLVAALALLSSPCACVPIAFIGIVLTWGFRAPPVTTRLS